MLLAVAALAVSCGSEPNAHSPEATSSVSADTASAERTGGRYGLTIGAPDGWDQEITRGAIRFANRALPELALCDGPRELRPDDLVVDVLERDPPPSEQSYFPQVDEPPRLAAVDFQTPEPDTHAYANVPFSLGGRFFVVFAESGTRSVAPEVVDEANAALSTLTVEPGDFYPGDVNPASFAAAEGWHTGSSGPLPVHSDGDYTVSWAATVPYLDEWDALPLYDTLDTLRLDGIVIRVSLARSCDPSGPGQRWPVRPQPYGLADFELNPQWEGQVRDIPEYQLGTRVEGQYDVDVRVYFGQAAPTEEMQARTQDELDRLELPDWGPWELE